MSNTKKAAGKATPRKRSKPDVMSLVAQVKLPEKTVALHLRGDLVAELEDLERRIQECRGADGRLTGNPVARKLAEQVEGLREQMADSLVVFRLRALPRREFIQFQLDHKAVLPADGKVDEATIVAADQAYTEGLLKACCLDPVLEDEQWMSLLDALSGAQWVKLSEAVVALNTETVNVPFSPAASFILQPSDKK